MSLEDMTIDQVIEYARQQEGHAGSTQLLQMLGSNPKTRERLQRLIKEVSPNTSIPEIDAVDRANDAIIKPLKDKIESLERAVMERDILQRLEKQRGECQAKYRLTDDDMRAVETLITDKENPLPNYDVAARLHLASRTSAVPTPASFVPPTYSMPEKDTWARGIGNPQELNRIAMNEAFTVWNDLAAGKVPGLGANRGAPMFAR
jgi:hypothetical protein